MTPLTRRSAGLLVGLLALAACHPLAPIYNVRSAAFPDRRGLDARTAQIQQAAATLGWITRVVQPGQIEATLYLRENIAVVEIDYSPTVFSISYVSSSPSLHYGHGEIHPNYNGWIENLEHRIIEMR